MTQKNETKTLLISLLITAGIVSGGVWWLNKQLNLGISLPATIGQSPLNADKQLSSGESSSGEKLLIPTAGTQAKQTGIQAFASGDYATAIAQLTASLRDQKNDPESLIYLNNARIANNKAYHLAVVVPLSNNLDGTQEILRGVAQAQNQLAQSGGIHGTPLRILIINDDNDPKVAQGVAKTLAAKPEILGVVGHWSSEVSLAAGGVYNAEKLVAISPISTSVELSGFSPYIFRTVPSDRFAGSALSRHLVSQLNRKKAAVFFNSKSNYSQSLKNEFTTTLFGDGGAVVAEFDLTAGNFKADNSLNQAISQGAEVLMLAVNSATLDQGLQVIQMNQGRLPVLAGDGAYAPKILQIGKENAVGLIVATPWHLLAHPQTAFVKTANTLWGGDINWRTAMAYDATQALISAIGDQPSPTRESIQQSLTNSNFAANGATGKVRFLLSGDRNQAVQLVKVEPGSRSGFGFDFVPIP